MHEPLVSVIAHLAALRASLTRSPQDAPKAVQAATDAAAVASEPELSSVYPPRVRWLTPRGTGSQTPNLGRWTRRTYCWPSSRASPGTGQDPRRPTPARRHPRPEPPRPEPVAADARLAEAVHGARSLFAAPPMWSLLGRELPVRPLTRGRRAARCCAGRSASAPVRTGSPGSRASTGPGPEPVWAVGGPIR
jgi:hypothetical protein